MITFIMKENHYSQDNDPTEELVQKYLSLKAGKPGFYLDEEEYERVVDYFEDLEDIDQALEAAEQGCEQFPYSSSLLLKKADLLITARKYHQALEILQFVELLDSNDINLYILKTDVYLALDQQEKAVSLLENALDLFDGEERLELLFELADVYDDYEEFGKVFDCLKLILEQDPTNEEALYKICFWSDFTNRNEESIHIHEKIIDDNPYCELAWFNLGAAYQGLKLYEKSVDAYKYAIAIDEKFDFAYRNMGDAYIRLRKFKDAIEMLEKVLELSRPEEVIYEAIGHCYDRLKNFAQARFYYKKASHLNPEDSKLHFKVATTYMNEANWIHAIKHLENALQLFKSHPEYNLAMGECKLQMKAYKEALHYFSIVISQRPRNISGWEAYLRCQYLSKNYHEALSEIEKLIYYLNKPLLYYYRAGLLIAYGKLKEGLLQLEQALQLAPSQSRRLGFLDPELLNHPSVQELMFKYRKKKTK